MKVLQTPARFYPYIGGVENHVYYLSKILKKKKIDVSVLCANEPFSEINDIKGVKIIRLPYQFKIANTNICLNLPWYLLTLDFDIIHTHIPTPWTADLSVLVAKLRGKKSVITIHADLYKSNFIGWILTTIYLNTIFLLTLSFADTIIIINPNWQNTFKHTAFILKRFNKKIRIVPNGVDTSLFRKIIPIKESNSLLFVSILDSHHKTIKGLENLIEAVKYVVTKLPDIKLYIIGDGDERLFYQNLVKSFDLSENVIFLGKKTQEELVKYYNNADVFILPSIKVEAFGIVLLESLACGTPVLTTTIAGMVNEINTYDCGKVIEPDSVDQLAKTITSMLSDKKKLRRQGNNGNKMVNKLYTWEIIANQILEIYDKK